MTKNFIEIPKIYIYSFVRFFRFTPKLVCSYLLAAVVQTITAYYELVYGARLAAELGRYVFGDKAVVTDRDTIISLFLLVVSFAAFSQLVYKLTNYIERLIYITWQTNGMISDYERIARLDYLQHTDPKLSQMIDRVSNGLSYTLIQSSMQIMYLFYNIFQLAVFGSALIIYSPLIALLLVSVLLPSLYFVGKEQSAEWGIWSDSGDESRIMDWSLWLTHDRKGMPEVKVGIYGPFLFAKTREIGKMFGAKLRKSTNKLFVPSALARLLEVIAQYGVQAHLLFKLLNNAIEFSRYTFLVSIISKFSSSLSMIGYNLSTLTRNIQYMKEYRLVMNLSPVIVSRKDIKLSRNNGIKIEFDNVSFTYPGAKNESLKTISFTIEPGQNIAIIGQNGAGKSTALMLLFRLFDPTSGRILINDIDLRDIELVSYYRAIGALFQNFVQPVMSVKDAIEMGKDSNKKDLDSALESSRFKQFLPELKAGIDTKLGIGLAESQELSGGQWQRLSLARAFYGKPKLLILDEPTSAIDAEAEAEIFTELEAKMKSDQTLILVSHRFSTVRNCDRIIVFDKGAIIESGTHTDLLVKKGKYAKLFTQQAKAYK
jgi:ATP-binding cassette, subfamily B, bacterial